MSRLQHQLLQHLGAAGLALALTTLAAGQTAVPCPPTPLTEKQVLDQVAAGVPATRTVVFISTCHVGFVGELESSLERLTKGGASSVVLDAARRDAFARMSLGQAKQEVAALEQRIQDLTRSSEAERDRELATQNAEYEKQRALLQRVAPKDRFETDQDVESRRRKAADAIAKLERDHQSDRDRVTARYLDGKSRQIAEITGWISGLKAGIYPLDNAVLKFEDNDANHDVLFATVNGERYWFSIPNDQAKTLYGRWDTAKAAQPYEDDAGRTRYLVDSVTTRRFKGVFAGTPAALRQIGEGYRDGKGYAQSFQEAMWWLRRSSDAGDAAATNGVARLYHNGQGVGQDFSMAMQWYQKAAALGDSAAMNNIGVLYWDGLGVPKSPDEAVRWYRRSAEAGNAFGMLDLGVAYFNGLGTQKSYPDAIQWLRKAADGGNAAAMNWVGQFYRNGWNVDHDEAEAVRWYRKAADAGEPNGMNNLGFSFERGLGVEISLGAALEWYQKGAGLGNTSAMTNLGNLYWNASGVARDYVEAVRWYQKAAGGGHLLGMVNLANAYDGGLGTKQDVSQARQWYLRAAEAGNTLAMFRLAGFYRTAKGGPRDDAQALAWYQKAAEGGLVEAKQAVDEIQKAAQQRQALAVNSKVIPDAWYDINTGLMWTAKDNGKNITWAQGRSYCQALRIGGVSNWRLATITELTGLYDPSKRRTRMSGRKAWDWLNSTEPSNVVVPGLESYHIKGDIILSQMYSWSSTTEPGKDGPEAWIVTFANGTKVKVDVRAQDGRTLCVREE